MDDEVDTVAPVAEAVSSELVEVTSAFVTPTAKKADTETKEVLIETELDLNEAEEAEAEPKEPEIEIDSVIQSNIDVTNNNDNDNPTISSAITDDPEIEGEEEKKEVDDEDMNKEKIKPDTSDDPTVNLDSLLTWKERMRARLRSELEIEKNFIIADHFDRPHESLEFTTYFRIQLLGDQTSGRESLLMQWTQNDWQSANGHSDNYFYKDVTVHGKHVNLDIMRSYQGTNIEDYNESALMDGAVNCYIIVADAASLSCTVSVNRLLEKLLEKRRDYRSLSVVLVAAKCDDFLEEVDDQMSDFRVKDEEHKELIISNVEELKQLAKRFYKQDLSIVFIPTSAKCDWNVTEVFQSSFAQWMSVNEYEYLEAKRVQEELSKDAALDCCMNPIVLVLYDAITIIVSLADISTDLWVLVHWYLSGRTVPFYISLTILTCAQLSYIGAFILRFCDNGNWSFHVPPKYTYQHSIWLVLLIIVPISPLLSFVMYFASLKDGCFGEWMKSRDFSIDQPSPSKNSSKIERFLVEKLFKHMGFLLEAGVEAFPQSILQMAVMVYYGETNWVSVVSILLSLISVCTKSLVFSYALEMRTFVFNYISLCLDFISIFALISWIFYNPHSNGISTLGTIFIYRIACTTVPFITICGFICATAISFEDWHYQRRYGRHPYKRLCKRLCGFYTMWIMGTPFAILMSEVACCAGLAFIMFFLFSNRFSAYSATAIFWGHVFSFVNDGRTWADKKLRCVLVIEAVMSGNGSNDLRLKNYISESRQQTYANVTWSGLRKNVQDPDISSPCSLVLTAQREILKEHRDRTAYLLDWQRLKTEWNSVHSGPKRVMGHIISWPIGLFCVYIAMPIYVMSRFFNFSFVWISFLTTDWNDIEYLQLGMAGLLGILQLTWLIALIMVLRLHFVTWHIMAGHTSVWLDCPTQEEAYVRLKRITDLHDAHTTEPERRKVIIDHFGPDIASVLLEYTPTLIYDIGEGM